MELTVYSAAWCPDCREAKRFLAKHNIPYKEIDVETTPGAVDEIVKHAGKHAIPQFVIDGEAVVLGVDGVADFNALHPASKTARSSSVPSTCWRWTARMSGICRYRCARPTWTGYSRGRPDGIFINPFETGAIGPDLFRAACVMGLEASAATGLTEEDGRRTG